MTRHPYQGWLSMDPDPLTVPDDPPPALREPARAAGCRSWFAVAALLLTAFLLVALAPAPQGAPEGTSPLDPARVPAADHADVRAVGDRLPAFPGASAARTTTAGAPTGAIGTVLLGGYATWYETRGYTAAAGPLLRDVLGRWRGQLVEVESGGRSVTVTLTDACACGERHGIPTLLDLSDAAFAELAPLSAGVIRVSIEIGPPPDPRDDAMRDEVRDLPLPATDAE